MKYRSHAILSFPRNVGSFEVAERCVQRDACNPLTNIISLFFLEDYRAADAPPLVLLDRGDILNELQSSVTTAKELMEKIFRSAEEFCREVGFSDDATVLVVKCNFGKV